MQTKEEESAQRGEERGEKKKKKIFKTRQLVGGPRPGTRKVKNSRYRIAFAEKNLPLSVKYFSFHFLPRRVVWITPSSLEGRGAWRL
jgi:hypothetical protein